MADVNKSVEITLRANIKQLQDSLESIPNMTKAEAQAMTRALSAEFAKAEKAAKKAAQESKAAAQATSTAYQQTSKSVGASFDKIASDARSTSQEVKVSFEAAASSSDKLSRGAETIGTSFGAANLAVSKLMPGLDEGAKKALDMADGLATVAEQAIKGGPVTMAFTGIIIAGAAAYDLMTSSSRKNREALKEQLEAFRGLSEEIKRAVDASKAFSEGQNVALKNQALQATSRTYDIMWEIELLQGKITQKQFDLNIAKNNYNDVEKEILDNGYRARVQMDKDIAGLQDKLKLLGEEKSINQQIAMDRSASDQEKREARKEISRIVGEEQLLKKTIQEINHNKQESLSLDHKATAAAKEQYKFEQALVSAKHAKAQQEKAAQEAQKVREKLQKELEQNAQTILAFEEKAAEAQKTSRDLMIASLPMEDQIAARAQERSAALEEQVKIIEAQLLQMELMADTEDKRDQFAEAQISANKAIMALRAEQTLIEEESLTKIQEIKDKTAQDELDNLAKIEEAKKKADEEEAARAEKARQEEKARINAKIEEMSLIQQVSLGTFSSTLSTISSLAEATGQKNAEIIQGLFIAQRIAAVGEVAFNTAKAITAAGAYPPPFNGLMIAGAIAAGAAQTASIFAQETPKFHMGGMTPDESIAVVKSGEAVLDRATVNRLGGETGVNRLQNGGSSAPQVIVTNPYKHFDRYMTDRQRAGLSSRSAQRGY